MNVRGPGFPAGVLVAMFAANLRVHGVRDGYRPSASADTNEAQACGAPGGSGPRPHPLRVNSMQSSTLAGPSNGGFGSEAGLGLAGRQSVGLGPAIFSSHRAGK